MQCYVYRSSKEEGLYVYLADPEGLQSLPEAVLRKLGSPELAMEFDLQPDRKLGQENTADVLANLKTRGFHIQMPRSIESILHDIASKPRTPTD